MSNDPGEPDMANAGRTYSSIGGGAKMNVNLPTAEVAAFTAAVTSLNTAMGKFAQSAPGYATSINRLNTTVGAPGSGGGMMSSIGNIAGSMFGSVNERGWAKDLLMFPSRYIRSAVTDNRQMALQASAGLGMQAFGSGADTTKMMGALAGQFGGVLGGSPQDLVNLMQIGSRVGAGVDWRYFGNTGLGANNPYSQSNSPRAAGFLKGVYEAQRINPGADVGSLAASVGGYAGNVGAQQQSMMLTGGAFSMIGAGNRQKSISEWADGILKWLGNLRGGPDRGKPFSYAELMTQNFPGSNIDAWLTANGVTEDMKGYFWSYALAQAGTGHSTTDELFTRNAAVNTSVAFNRLQASAATTRTGFQLAGSMGGAYANKEQANRFFAEMTGHMLNQVLPTAMGSGALSFMQYLPDSIEEIIMQLAERTGVGTAAAGVTGWGSMFPQLLGAGDVGDVGDYGSYGGSSTAGLHPDTRKRVDSMMAANPRLRVTSGFRDLGTQQRLKRKGVGRVSGRPSAHTRGFAADLGPRSEYPWIVANAGRFGLKSGNHAGEPWHVGMGDIGDPVSDLLGSLGGGASGALALPGLLSALQSTQFGSTLTNMFGNLFGGIFGGGGPDAQISAVGGASSLMMQLLMGVYGEGAVSSSNLAFRPDMYSQLVNAANNARGPATGVTTGGGGGWFNNIFKKVTDVFNPTPGVAVSGSGTSLNDFFTQALTSLGAPISQNNLLKLGAVAKFEGNRATFNPFNSIGGDYPNKFNSAGVENYPDWPTGVQYLARLLNQENTSGMRNNLLTDGTYGAWRNAVSGFYGGWGGSSMPSISEGSAAEMLTHKVAGVGDIDAFGVPTMNGLRGGAAAAPIFFANTFKIDGTAVGSGVDLRKTANLLADQLEEQMRQRMARSN